MIDNPEHISEYQVDEFSEPAAGIYAGENEVRIEVAYGTGGQPGEFEDYMEKVLSWRFNQLGSLKGTG